MPPTPTRQRIMKRIINGASPSLSLFLLSSLCSPCCSASPKLVSNPISLALLASLAEGGAELISTNYASRLRFVRVALLSSCLQKRVIIIIFFHTHTHTHSTWRALLFFRLSLSRQVGRAGLGSDLIRFDWIVYNRPILGICISNCVDRSTTHPAPHSAILRARGSDSF